MTSKELKKLNRAELLEILVRQSKEIDSLRAEIKALNEKLEERKLVLANVGSIAEASLRLNDIFEVAQRTADQYIESVMALYEPENVGFDANADEQKTNKT